ncbi:SprT family protein [Lacticaseibacillus zhaodongensis]|uniref:SprT family protein n=1 Tax=Lacticaseibacillus zhaodongensis TaxID=2668065 RepID=UPI0012D2A091|nr:SprT family protein [Lacticaseibacillus zhaodongensis]
MTNEDLLAAVRTISERDFDLPFNDQAVFNSRLRTSGGRFNPRTHNLDFNPHLFASCTAAQRVGIIRHELCHYHLYLQGRGYQHRDADFKRLLQQVGGLRFAPRIRDTVERVHLYACSRCGRSLIRRRRVDTRKYVCAHCGGRIVMRQEAILRGGRLYDSASGRPLAQSGHKLSS